MSNKEIAVIEKKLLPTVKEVESLSVTDEATEKKAAEMLSVLNVLGDKMKETKAKVYDPAWSTVVAIRAEWKPREDMIAGAVASIRAKMNAYRTEAKKKADAEAAAIAERVGEGRGKFTVETAVRKIEEIDAPKGAVTTGAGVVKYKTVKKFVLGDITKVPKEYLLLNEVAVRAAMLKGVEVQGVHYFEEQVPVSFR